MRFYGGLLCFVHYVGQKITITQKRGINTELF